MTGTIWSMIDQNSNETRGAEYIAYEIRAYHGIEKEILCKTTISQNPSWTISKLKNSTVNIDKVIVATIKYSDDLSSSIHGGWSLSGSSCLNQDMMKTVEVPW